MRDAQLEVALSNTLGSLSTFSPLPSPARRPVLREVLGSGIQNSSFKQAVLMQ
jgi:hypothetical protein